MAHSVATVEKREQVTFLRESSIHGIVLIRSRDDRVRLPTLLGSSLVVASRDTASPGETRGFSLALRLYNPRSSTLSASIIGRCIATNYFFLFFIFLLLFQTFSFFSVNFLLFLCFVAGNCPLSGWFMDQ